MADKRIGGGSFQEAVAHYSRHNPGVAIAAARIKPSGVETAYFKCSPASRFEIGSITKVFTTILLAEAVIEGRCQLDDPVDLWLPKGVRAPRYRGKQITLRHLATHTSGLSRLPLGMLPVAFTSSQPYANFDRTRLSKSIRSSRLMRPPGSTYSYSNFGFAVLGLALEKVYGEPFEELLPRLTARLGCGEIRLPRDGDLVAKGLAVAPWKMAAFAPAGAATATLDAMITFAQINLNPNRAAELSMAIQERRRYRTHPPFGSGLPLTFALAAIAGGVTRAIPDSFFVPLLCAEMATFSAGWLGGGLVTLAWEAATFWNCSPLAMAEQRVGFGLFATLLGLYAANRQQSQSMGLGWHSAGAASDAVIWHNGGTAGFRSCIGLRPAAATGTIVLAANKQSVDSLARHLSKF